MVAGAASSFSANSRALRSARINDLRVFPQAALWNIFVGQHGFELDRSRQSRAVSLNSVWANVGLLLNLDDPFLRTASKKSHTPARNLFFQSLQAQLLSGYGFIVDHGRLFLLSKN